MRRLLEALYRSPVGFFMSWVGTLLANIQKPFMVYGFRDPATSIFRKFTRISSNVVIMNKEGLGIGDHVWIWHHSILDATTGLTIGEGCQIGAWVGVFTHGSERAIRLLGKEYVNIPQSQRLGYTRGKVTIGAYSFLAARSVILPGVTVGKGCLIGAGSVVAKDVPDYSIVVGSPAQVKGSTIDLDFKQFLEHDFSDTYYDQDALVLIQQKIAEFNKEGDDIQ